MRRKKIVIDANSITPLYINGYLTGVGRSTMELLKALDCIKPETFDIDVCTQNFHGLKLLFLKNLKYHHLYWSNKKIFHRIGRLFQLKKLLLGYDLYHVPHNTGECENLADTIFTIHDLIVYRYPEMWGLTDKDRNEYKRIASKCRHIVTCSETSKQDIVNFWGVEPWKVTVIPWGINREVFRYREDKDYLKSKGIYGDYFFSAACNHVRKNMLLLLKAFEKYVEDGGKSQLVLLGAISKELQDYKELIETNKIVCLYNVSDSELAALYSGAKVSIVTSLYEGFCFPILESIACGTPVICSRNSCLEEVGSDVVEYLYDDTPETLTKTLSSVDDKKKYDIVKHYDFEAHLSKYTWQKCAEQYVDMYKNLLK